MYVTTFFSVLLGRVNVVIVWSMAQASKAITPRDPGGPFGQRIGVKVNGSLNWALRVGAYVVNRADRTDQKQYSIVVLNCEQSDESTLRTTDSQPQGTITPMGYGTRSRYLPLLNSVGSKWPIRSRLV